MSINIKFPTLAIDFVGQRQAEKIFQIVIPIFAVAGFIWGYIQQQFSQTLLVLAAGLILSCLIILPPWPVWNRNPVKWQKVREESAAPTTQTSTDGATKETEKKKK